MTGGCPGFFEILHSWLRLSCAPTRTAQGYGSRSRRSVRSTIERSLGFLSSFSASISGAMTRPLPEATRTSEGLSAASYLQRPCPTSTVEVVFATGPVRSSLSLWA